MPIHNPPAGSGSLSYKVYTFLLNQTGMAAPVPIVLQNTFTGALTWSRVVAGRYRVSSAAFEFTANKTWVVIMPDTDQDPTIPVGAFIQATRLADDTVEVTAYSQPNAPADATLVISADLDNTTVGFGPLSGEIRVYP